MASITFVPIAPSANFFFSDDGEPPPGERRGPPGLSWSINVDRGRSRQEIRLSTGKNLRELPGTLRVRVREASPKVGTTDLADDPTYCSSMHYFPSFTTDFVGFPESYSVELYVSVSVFDRLLRLAELGRPPTVNVDLGYDLSPVKSQGDKKGAPVQMGWEPDGSGMDWDNKDRPHVKVIWFSFCSALGLPLPELDEDDEDKKQLAILGLVPPTRADLVAIQQSVVKMDSALARIASTVTFLAFLIVAVLIVRLFFH